MAIESADVYSIALAIGKANRHPDPAWWASRAQAAFDGTEMPELVEPGPAEEALETPPATPEA